MEKGNLTDWLDDENLLNIIKSAIKSKTKSYHYVLPTQIVAKLAEPSLDCRCIQAGRAGIGSFDARSVADEVIVPFDQKNDRVLGGSPEPYVNKPLRCEEFSERFRNQQKNKQDWDGLCFVLNKIEEKNDP
ncbi:MAG: restriction endonuclease, SacI family, partial [Deltaproteobacteria bacterium]|nr:restriction endonuclease, SacI family [Deltaproteobacteria bacterium]